MLYIFLSNYRDTWIDRCHIKEARRSGLHTEHALLTTGVPMFVDQLIQTLKLELNATPRSGFAIFGPARGPSQKLCAETKISANRFADPEIVLIDQLLGDIKASLAHDVDTRKCKFDTYTVGSGVAGKADKDLLSAAIKNLRQKAFKFTHPGACGGRALDADVARLVPDVGGLLPLPPHRPPDTPGTDRVDSDAAPTRKACNGLSKPPRRAGQARRHTTPYPVFGQSLTTTRAVSPP